MAVASGFLLYASGVDVEDPNMTQEDRTNIAQLQEAFLGLGVGTLIGGLALWALGIYTWRIVQSEYLNMKNSNGPIPSKV